MKTNTIFTTALLLLLSTSAPIQAGLIIERLTVRSSVVGVNSLGIHSTSGPLAPFGLPSLVTATDEQGGLQALSLQTKSGFFRDQVEINQGSLESQPALLAYSVYLLIVGTDTPDTPLVLDFSFFGATAKGSAYFSFGDINARVSQIIEAEHRAQIGDAAWEPSLSEVWRFGAQVNLASAQWTHAYATNDTQNIGMPTLSVQPLFGLAPEGYVRSTGLKIELAPFLGTLNFGVLQPGQYFALRYEAETRATSTGAYGLGDEAFAGASIVDPFSLGGTPSPQLSLRGLTLPFSASIGPKLELSLVGSQQARLTWPTNATGYALEFASSLPATLWTTITNTPTVLSNQFVLQVDAAGGSKFYRLRKP